ncbi:hypothetical protein HISP_03790 [Haloarcula hispanica N601]|uniref:Chlor_Arch_YYY domain-containing protein n=2 Tax=Haloarcula hispanica TaxID=51589 RepID=V5TJA1_HALHI|nr:DUF2298 domain-containing protein [Haloarcula hispanica]AEM56358.1 conserved hypothetical protein [Haloarcula hispanica ATCC 33960]AHB65168.1 hypothetical protein HISP_03790 [Haloarcula hispanica N601]
MEYGLLATWLALYLLLLYAGGTVAGLLFPRFADRGLTFGVPVAVSILWIITYFVGRLSLTLGVWLGITVLAVSTLAVWRADGGPSARSYAETAGVFTVAFLFLVGIRALDPAIVPIGGEKFLDFGLLQSLVRADSLPLEDMWFAGEPVAYYYGGHLVAAILTRITGTAGQFAYNLALAGFYATLVTVAYGLAGAVASERGLPRRLAAGLTAFCVGIASNLSTPAKFVIWLLPGELSQTVAERAGYELEGLAAGPDSFSYWDASRVIEDSAADFGTYEPGAALVIDEFPLFAWLNGDMHAHMMSTGFLLLAAALCFSYYQTPAAERRRRLALLFGALPAVAGIMAVTNTWSFPSMGGLALLTVTVAPADPTTLLPKHVGQRLRLNGASQEGVRIGLGLAVAAVVIALGLLWSLPFWLGPASGREIAVLPDRTSLLELLAVHGLFVAPFWLYLYAQTGRAVGRSTARIVGLVTVGTAALAATLDIAAVGLLVPLLLGAWLFARSPTLDRTVDAVPALADGGDRPVGFEAVLILAGAGLVLLVEFVFVRENIGRMNTVFKTYMQVWVLWGVAAGPVLAWLLTRWRPTDDRARAWTSIGVRTFVALLVCSASLYGMFALSNHVEAAGDPTLDGLAYLDDDHPEEAEAIRWLDDNTQGRPTIVTAAPASYQWDADDGEGASAPSSLTGLPTVAGWTHEAQYRNDTVYDRRVDDVATIYTGEPAEQRRLLEAYDVRYVYVGPAERARYDDVTVDQLQGVTVAKQADGVTIYQVRPEYF